MFPTDRPRRLRTTPALRRLVSETDVLPRHLVLPVFLAEGLDAPKPISSMPGVVQHTVESLRKAAAEAAAAGLGGIMLFGVPARHDATGSGAVDPDGIHAKHYVSIAREIWTAIVTGAAHRPPPRIVIE